MSINKIESAPMTVNTHIHSINCNHDAQEPINPNYPFKLSKNSSLNDYLLANRLNMDKLKLENPDIMTLSAKGQNPHTLWIGCSDSRINEATALGCLPGEIFTLRNIANVIKSDDLSSMSALQFAIDVLKVKKIIVCGHTDCGGVWASLSNKKTGGNYLDGWLNHVRSIRSDNLDELKNFDNINDKCKRLVELNTLNSVKNISSHPSFIQAYSLGNVEIFALVYDVESGYLRELPIEDAVLKSELV